MASDDNQQPPAGSITDTNNQPNPQNSPPDAPQAAPMASNGNQQPPADDTTDEEEPPKPNINWLVRYKYNKKKDPYNDMRTVLLVVSALIAAITFQAGVNPPGGVWQDNSEHHKAGSAIYAAHKKPFYVFLVFNTLALSSSVSVIISLTFLFPFSVEIWIATVSMLITYGSSIFAITPHHGDYKFRYLLITAAFPLVARVAVEACRYIKRKHYSQLTWKDIESRLWRCRESD